MDAIPSLPTHRIRELTNDEIDEVSGAVFFVAPVIIKIITWSIGAAIGGGLALGAIQLIEK